MQKSFSLVFFFFRFLAFYPDTLDQQFPNNYLYVTSSNGVATGTKFLSEQRSEDNIAVEKFIAFLRIQDWFTREGCQVVEPTL